jgi:hypothetical protein
MPLTYGWEPLLGLLANDRLGELVKAHWAEIALDTDKVPLAVNWKLYLAREEQGTWRAFVARRDGKLAGYIGFHFHRPDRYQSTLYIQEDTIWVVPEEKNRGLVWASLWKHALSALPRPAKVQGKVRLKDSEARAGRILERLGLPAVEMLHSAYLE